MIGKLVFKTNDKYIDIYDDRLEELDYSMHYEVKDEEDLRNLFSSVIADLDGEFKILINPQDINLKEMPYHKDITDFNHMHEINVKYDCSDKKEFIKRIGDMMLASDLVLDCLFDRFCDDLDNNKKKRCLQANITDNLGAKLNILGNFLEERFKEKDSYLFVRELEEFCRNINEKEKENDKKK